LTLVSADEDRELEAIRQIIVTHETAASEDDIIATLRGRASRAEHIATLDLIGHSCRPGFLVLGTWVLDDRPQTAATFQIAVRPLLRQLGVRTIRLLGCSTATSEPGRRAIQAIARSSGCDVLGTTRYLSTRDYAPAGFISEHVLTS